MQPQSKLIAKDSEEHERYFNAFLEDEVMSWTVEDLFGTVHVVRAKVFRVEHAGDKTRFTLFPTKTF